MEKGEVIMDAYAVKPKLPFVAKTDLKRTPATEENRKMIEFMDSHDFSFSYDRETKELKSHVTPKK
jgi:hypothetical protein